MQRLKRRSHFLSIGALGVGAVLSALAPSRTQAQPSNHESAEAAQVREALQTRSAALMAQFVAGTLTPKDAWQQGLLTVDDLLYMRRAGAG
jgi:hypothetical protein